MRMAFVICADLDCLLEKMSTCRNNPEKSQATKISKHTAPGISLFTCCLFDTAEKNEVDCYRSKD